MAQTLTLDDLLSDAAAAQSGKPTKSDDEVLRQGLNRSGGSRNRGGGVSLGAQERLNEQASSMIIDGVDYRDPQKPLGDQPSSRYDLDKQPAVVSEDPLGAVPVETQTQRMPPEYRSVSALTGGDLRTLAKEAKFPKDFDRFPKNTPSILVGDEYIQNPREVYAGLKDEYEREDFLRGLKRTIDKKILSEQEAFEQYNSEGAAYVKGAVVGALAAAPILGPAYAASIPFLPILKATAGLGIPVAAAGFYKSPAERAEDAEKRMKQREREKQDQAEARKSKDQLIQENKLLRQKIERQNSMKMQQDTGSPPIVEKQPDVTKEQQLEAYDQGKPVNF